MLQADDRKSAVSQEALFQDKRLSHYWDGDRVLGRLVAHRLDLTAPVAWDIYLLYYPGAVWDEIMPLPDFWMHQLDERSDLRLDPSRLSTEVQKAIEAIS